MTLQRSEAGQLPFYGEEPFRYVDSFIGDEAQMNANPSDRKGYPFFSEKFEIFLLQKIKKIGKIITIRGLISGRCVDKLHETCVRSWEIFLQKKFEDFIIERFTRKDR